MTKAVSVLVIGGALSPAAEAEAATRGLSLTTCGPYPDASALADEANAVDARALILRLGRIPREAVELMPDVRIIAKHGVGTDGIDLDAAAERNVPVVVAVGANAQSVAEQGLALLLGVARSTALLDRRIRAGHWDKATYAGGEISGKSVGLIGLGAIGRAFLALLQPFGVTARIYDPYLSDDLLPSHAERVDTVTALLEGSDIVSLHCPLTAENRGLIDADAITRMKPGAIIINTARGELIDEDALVAALRDGHLGGAGLDTFAREPITPDHPLLALDNVVVSPHVGANTREARARVGVRCIEQIADYLERGTLDPRNHANARARATV
ncbi:hydroxyacid dehydrogenase [Sphingomonas sp. Mn802worker]|uniref:hydroxyacid dehydrogenase n=1 Tax=Sphingomonas sp. Mn802worker TaxID=629773 RepID=UPI000399F918|nr:hydroxyacid dehydrogenase [Sphingomonas sp. Mn802worker]